MHTESTLSSDTPKISVCIPSYNYGHLIGEAIASVLAQDSADFELIVCDNQSTDNSEEVIRSFEDPRLRYYRNESNLGIYGNLNRAISLSRGKYIHFLNADDKMLPRSLSTKARHLDAHPEVGLVYSACQRIDFDGKLLWEHRPFDESYIADPRTEFNKLMYDNLYAFSTVMVRKSCYQVLGVFDNTFTHSGDYDMWLRIASQYHVAYLSAPLTAMRQHDANSTNRALADGRAEAESLTSLEHAFANLPQELSSLRHLKHNAIAQTLLRSAAYFLVFDNLERGRATIRRALQTAPDLNKDPETIFGILLGSAIEPLVGDRLTHIETVFANVPNGIKRLTRSKRKLQSNYYMKQVFDASANMNQQPSLRHMWQAIRLYPLWLANRGVLAIMLKAALGRRATI